MYTIVIPATVVDEHLTIYPLVPSDAGQSWKLELFELARAAPDHCHEREKQLILLLEGELVVSVDGKASLLQSGELAHIDPGALHSLTPNGKARFLAIEMVPPSGESLLDPTYFGARINQPGYGVYELLGEENWSAALLEIHDSPRHFHRIEREHFIVVSGVLDIEIDGQHQILEAGDAILLIPEQIHQLKSATKSPVRVLCFSFPAFDPADMHGVQ